MMWKKLALIGCIFLGACTSVPSTHTHSTSTPPQAIPAKQAKESLKVTVVYSKPVKGAYKISFLNKTYYIHSEQLDLSDIKTAFAAKTVDDRPALGVRLQPKVISKYNTFLHKRHPQFVLVRLSTINLAIIPFDHAKLYDGVLLIPVHDLVYARNLARLIRHHN